MRLIFVDVNPHLVRSWARVTTDVPEVEVVEGSIFDQACDALVSPANSFGFMDGGLDLSISQRFGWGVQARLQAAIREEYHGELLVGQAHAVPSEDAQIPWVIAAPTMRVPMPLGATLNPYLATRAVLLLVRDGALAGQVETVAFPGMGTGVGRVPPGICARQMRAAVGDVLRGETEFPETWLKARDRHDRLAH